MQTNTIVSEIREELEKVREFLRNDDTVKQDFNEYVKTIGTEDDITYIFERRLDEKSIFELYLKSYDNKVAKALSTARASIFEVKRVLRQGFILYDVINERTYNVTVISKMTQYLRIGIGHFVVARIFDYDGEYYLVEISAVLASNKREEAMRYAVAKILQEPYLVYLDNPDKQIEIETCNEKMYNKFLECFNSDEIVTTNKFADEIIGMFNDYAENDTPVELEGKIQEPKTYKYFVIKGLENDYNNFIEKSLEGFSSHSQIYDTGIIYDKECGLFVVPFYKTLCKIFEGEEIENADECIKYFLNAESVAPCLLKRFADLYENFVERVNQANDENLSFDEILHKYKSKFLEQKIFSLTTVLYNSKVFSNTLGNIVEEERKADIDYSGARRNDPCPCGSGKKYKHCCLK